MEHFNEKWQQLAIELGNSIYEQVNLPYMVGTDDETGYILMFFNVKNHNGKSTLISSAADDKERAKKNYLKPPCGISTRARSSGKTVQLINHCFAIFSINSLTRLRSSVTRATKRF